MAVSDQQKDEVKRLISEGRKIEAIKYVRSSYRLNLKQAKTLIEAVEEEMEPFTFSRPPLNKPSRRGRKGGKIVGSVFFGIGLIFLSIALFEFLKNQRQITNSIIVMGEVVENPSSPTIEYEYDGATYYYYSTVSSSPPSYYLGEEVEVFIDPAFPQNGIINTITDRWFFIILFGAMGSVFAIVGFIVMRLL